MMWWCKRCVWSVVCLGSIFPCCIFSFISPGLKIICMVLVRETCGVRLYFVPNWLITTPPTHQPIHLTKCQPIHFYTILSQILIVEYIYVEGCCYAFLKHFCIFFVCLSLYYRNQSKATRLACACASSCTAVAIDSFMAEVVNIWCITNTPSMYFTW